MELPPSPPVEDLTPGDTPGTPLPSSPFILPPRPLSPVESLAHSSSFMSLDLEEDITSILQQNKCAGREEQRESSILAPLWDALSNFSPSSQTSGIASTSFAWIRRSKPTQQTKKRTKEQEYHSGRAPRNNGAGPLSSSPLRESHSPTARRSFPRLEKSSEGFEQLPDKPTTTPIPADLECHDSPAMPQKPPRRSHHKKMSTHQELTDLFDRNNRAKGPFRPTTRSAGKGTPSWQLRQFAEATLGSGSLRKAVKLPEGEDENEWLAVNVVDFYNQINLLYGSITEFCSPTSCPEMKASDEYEYLWQDSSNPSFKRPTKMPAPEYIEHLMTWCQSNIDNQDLFPAKLGVAFPRTFKPIVTNMFKRLYRVYAHIYCHHYAVVVQLGLEAHLNTSFKHFCLFVEEFGLAGGGKKEDFWGPLGEFVDAMLKVD